MDPKTGTGSLRWLFAALILGWWLAAPAGSHDHPSAPAGEPVTQEFAPAGEALPSQFTGRLGTASAFDTGHHAQDGTAPPDYAAATAARAPAGRASDRSADGGELLLASFLDRVSYRTTGPPHQIG